MLASFLGALGIEAGAVGPILIILFALSLLSVALIVAKTLQLWPALGGRGPQEHALKLWQDGDKHGALLELRKSRSPASRVAAQAMAWTKDGVPKTLIDSELERSGNAEIEVLSRHLRLLELIAMIAPLLGLLGTVLGMIQSFQDLEMAQGAANAATLAGGIWQALLTTAAGLIVAIPAAMGASLLSSRIERVALSIEAAVGRFYLAEYGR